MVNDDNRYPTDRQTTSLIEQAQAMGKIAENLAVSLAYLGGLYVEPQPSLKAAQVAMREAAGQLAIAVKAMRYAQQDRASARKVSEAAHTPGCQHVLAVYPGKDGQYSVIGCERCHTSIEVDMAALREGDSAAVDALFASVEQTFGIPRALLSALAFQGTTLRGFDDWTGLMGTTRKRG